jgi:hypothetical protein
MRLYLIAGAAVAIAAALTWSHVAAYRAGAKSERVAQLAKSVEAYAERNRIDAEVDDLDRYAVCLDLGGLPGDCAAVRGVDEAAEAE